MLLRVPSLVGLLTQDDPAMGLTAFVAAAFDAWGFLTPAKLFGSCGRWLDHIVGSQVDSKLR